MGTVPRIPAIALLAAALPLDGEDVLSRSRYVITQQRRRFVNLARYCGLHQAAMLAGGVAWSRAIYSRETAIALRLIE